jgi:hypothetical protein
MDAIKEISGAMAGASTVAKQTAIADIFKGAGEDAGLQYLLSLKDTNLEMDDLIAKTGEVGMRKARLLDIEERTVEQQQRFSGSFNKLSDWWTEIVANAKLLFYEYMADGVDLAIELGGVFGSIWDVVASIGETLMSFGGLVWDVTIGPLIDGIAYLGEKLNFTLGNGSKGLFDEFGIQFSVMKLKFMDLMDVFKFGFKSLGALSRGNTQEASKYYNEAKQALLDRFGKDYRAEVLADRAKQNKLDAIEAKNKETEEEQKKKSKFAADPSLNINKAKSSVDSIEKTSASVKNITFNIEALHKGNNIIHSAAQAVGMTLEQFRSFYSEVLLAEIRDIERTY